MSLLTRIRELQAELAQRVDPVPQRDRAEVLAAWREGRPLFEGQPPAVSRELFREALERLRPLLPESEAGAIEELLHADAAELAGAPATLCFAAHTALTPFFERAAAPYADWIESCTWRRGACPMCGSGPALGRLAAESGKRTLFCALCRVEWPFGRLRCPFCEEQEARQPKVRFFTVEGDASRRVECCDLCGRYLKTVDERVGGRPLDLVVEELASAPLDAAAAEKGYR